MTRHLSTTWRWLALGGLLAGLAACGRACGEAHDATERVAERLVSVELEQRLGEQMADEFRQQVRLLNDSVVQGYVQELGAQLVAHAPGVPDGTRFEFRVIDGPDTVNAIAMPGGYIYVYSGLLRAAGSEAELAGVLAHEIAHVAERHVVARLITTLGIQTLTAIALGDEVGQLEQLISQLASHGVLSAYSRTAEREADELAVRYLVRAGWDPRGYVAFFETLAGLQARSPGRLEAFLASHPDPGARAAHARQVIAELEAIPTRTGDDAFRRVTARLAR